MAGVLFTAEFIALFESLRFTTAARATVFIYAAPFFVALGAAFHLKDERLKPIQWAGLGTCIRRRRLRACGRTPGGGLVGDALALLAAALWGATTIVIKATPLRRADPLKVLLYQIAVATVATPPLVYAFGEPAPAHLSAATVASLLWQGVAVVGVSYALWFWTLTNYAAAQLSAFTFVTPLVGVFAGWLVFGEGHGRIRAGDRPRARRARARQLAASSGFPSRPARSWMNCQAVRPEREPRVVAHSSASASSPSRGASRR